MSSHLQGSLSANTSFEMFRRTYAEINLESLVGNWNEIKNIAGDDRFICPMVKANAYGHGDVQVALALEKAGAQHLGVCLIEEGLLLRAAGVKAEILVFRGFDKIGAEKILEYQMTPVVSSWEQLSYLESEADETVKVHLKFDTGMNRIGFQIDQAEPLREFFKKSKRLKLKALLTHFAQGEDAYLEHGVSAQQVSSFAKAFQYFSDLGVYGHLLNSGGIASLAHLKKISSFNPEGHFLFRQKWGMRPGLLLYGYSPSPVFQSDLLLRPVMTLKSVVNNLRQIDIGESVSYGGIWKAARPSKIAVVPIGYADGIHRLISGLGEALFAGKRVPVVGRICMDFLMLDVTEVVDESQPLSRWLEEEVILFGYDSKENFLSAEAMAAKSQTIVWETLTAVGERVPRQFKGSVWHNRGLIKT